MLLSPSFPHCPNLRRQIHRALMQLAQSRQSRCTHIRSPSWSRTPSILPRRNPGTPTSGLDLVFLVLASVPPQGSRSPQLLRGLSLNLHRHSRRHIPPARKQCNR